MSTDDPTPITIWDGSKRELKKQFYPDDAKNEARAKLRYLKHNEGHIREYIREFQQLLLEIPSMGEQDALCYFLSLCGWVKMELKRRDMQDLTSAITAAKTLVEFKRSPLRDKVRRQVTTAKVGETETSLQAGQTLHVQRQGKGKNDESPRKYSYFLYNGPHRVFEYPKKGKLAALVQGEEEKEKKKIASLKLLNVVRAKVEKQPRGRMYVETLINGKPLQILLDTGADTIYMGKEFANEFGLLYTKEGGYVKGFNAKSLPIHGVARGTSIQID